MKSRKVVNEYIPYLLKIKRLKNAKPFDLQIWHITFVDRTKWVINKLFNEKQ